MAIKDLAFPTADEVRRTCKRKRLIPQPSSSFLYLRCKACEVIIMAYSHSQTVRVCPGCNMVMMRPRGGKAIIEEGVKIKYAKRIIE